MSDNAIPTRDADDAKADDGPPTDAASDEVKAYSASDAMTDAGTRAGEGESSASADTPPTEASPAAEDEDATARVDEPSD